MHGNFELMAGLYEIVIELSKRNKKTGHLCTSHVTMLLEFALEVYVISLGYLGPRPNLDSNTLWSVNTW